MYLHLGNNYIINARDIVAILNMEPPVSADIKDIIEIAELDRKLINISSGGKEKALIVCEDQCYLSPISSLTLFKRASNPYKEE